MSVPVLVLCLGNALRRDDAVALHVADALSREGAPGVTVRRSAAAGLYLLDDMEGFDRVVVVDAVRTGGHPPGTVLAFPLDALHAPEGPSPHAIGLPSALARAAAAGAPVPSRIEVVAVEALALDEVGEGLTPAVAAAVPAAVAAVWRAVAALAAP
ncbi:hydrogenase maturation protease [Anaeromyxobacter sp. SG17]|uniref:hydrogenase maturation protease n=1 Tax=Anaeromyxobacter sp. SG17 TaxID=2925405 RepID=UPI001F569122|nr:hydrogenase maturation protease [Anaeromyxobacter sp. SG17]